MSTLIEEITVTSYFPIYTVPKTMNKLVAILVIVALLKRFIVRKSFSSEIFGPM